jgi:hypothetical protein
MNISYPLVAQDYLDFQLYSVTKSEKIQRKKKKNWWVTTIGFFVFSLFFFLQKYNPIAIYFLVLGIVSLFFYPKYFAYRHKSHFKKYNQKNYKHLFGKKENLIFDHHKIHVSNEEGEGDILLKEIVEVIETQNHFFIKINNGNALIIPKNHQEEWSSFLQFLAEKKIKLIDDKNWQWR